MVDKLDWIIYYVLRKWEKDVSIECKDICVCIELCLGNVVYKDVVGLG